VDTESTLSPEIPVFKERRMYGKKDGLETSYRINNSFCGILRLSPNNTATLYNKNNFITNTEETESYINYSDDIQFLLENQFISVSTSDGIMLSMHVSNEGIEYNNLYVLGTVETPYIVNYIIKNENGKFTNKFKLGDINMPNKPHINYTGKVSDTDASPEYYEINNSHSTEKRREYMDKTFILINDAEDGEESNFIFKNAKELVDDFIQEALLNIQSLPTGSIHCIPVNIEQYQKLLDKSSGTHNSGKKGTIPLIRDFLLCDGALYRNKDFPELAKILNGEIINYWEPNGRMETYINGSSSSGIVNTNEKYFRVPDLRGMFIQYVAPEVSKQNAPIFIEYNKVGSWTHDYRRDQESIIKAGENKHYHYIVLDNSINKQHNTVRIGKKGFKFASTCDENYNWIDEPSYSTSGTEVEEWFIKKLRGDADTYDEYHPKENANEKITAYTSVEYSNYGAGTTVECFARPLAKYGSMYKNTKRRQGINWGNSIYRTIGCDTRNCAGEYEEVPPSFIYPTVDAYWKDGTKSFCNSQGPTCGYVLAATSNKMELSNYIGLSSRQINTMVPLNKIDELQNKANYTNSTPASKIDYRAKKLPEINNDQGIEIYGNEYAHANNYVGLTDLLRKENTPEFYACLPMIKI
jgi:hypothetical protein